jgi:hypothetical protein
LFSAAAISKLIVRDTEKVVSELGARSQAGLSNRSASHEALLGHLGAYGPTIVDHNLSKVLVRNVAQGRLDPTLIQWFGWLADVGADWLLVDERIEKTLIEISRSKIREEQDLAVKALASLEQVVHSEQTIPILLERMEQGRGVSTRDGVLLGYRERWFDALALHLDDERVVQAFLSYLEDDICHIRVKAVEALGTVPDDDRVIEALVKALDDREEPGKRDTTGFWELAETEGPSAGKRARKALKALTGQDLGPRSRDWQAWMEAQKGNA